MGCDGGTIPTRDELVRTKKKPEQVSERKYMSNLQTKTFKFLSLTERQRFRQIIQMETLCTNTRTIRQTSGRM